MIASRKLERAVREQRNLFNASVVLIEFNASVVLIEDKATGQPSEQTSQAMSAKWLSGMSSPTRSRQPTDAGTYSRSTALWLTRGPTSVAARTASLCIGQGGSLDARNSRRQMHQEALRRSCIKTGKPALVDAVTQHR